MKDTLLLHLWYQIDKDDDETYGRSKFSFHKFFKHLKHSGHVMEIFVDLGILNLKLSEK